MLASSDGGTPATFTRRARELETELAQAQAAIATAERELVATARTDLQGADAKWRVLADGVEAQDYDTRLQTRQLVADTFERIVVYHHGVRPGETPAGVIDVMLLAKGGTARMLRISTKDGKTEAESVAEMDAP